MTVLADKVLELLEKKRGESLSGQELAEQLGVTRSAVWKAINALRSQGHVIDAVTNRGYQLAALSDVLSKEAIKYYLKEQYKDITIEVEPSVPSTNDIAKIAALHGAPHGMTILAEEQTAGRGRRGRSFFSPAHSGLYMSVILKPNIQVSDAVLFTLGAAVAVCETLEEELMIAPKIKWVNDIFYQEKKVCGILTETVSDVESGEVDSMVVGIGINVTTSEPCFPKTLQAVAGSVCSESGQGALRSRLAAGIISRVLTITGQWPCEHILSEYRKRSMVLDEKIIFYEEDAWHPAIALDIDEHGGLVIQQENGKTRVLRSGDISIKKQ